MKTQYYSAMSLDGYIATKDDSLDWLYALGDPENSSYPAFIQDVGVLVMGSATYNWVHRNIVGPDAKEAQPWPYEQPSFVISSRDLPPMPDVAIQFRCGDLKKIHAELVQVAEGKNIWIVGGGELAGQFHDLGLLDEIIVQVGSALLGSGKPLLPRAIWNPPLRLLSADMMGPGFVELRYEVKKPSCDD